MCSISHSRNFYSRFSRFSFRFSFLFSSFLFFPFFFSFPFSFSVFLSFLLFLHAQAHARANQWASFSSHAIPSQHRIPGVGPATNARFSCSSLALSRVLFTNQSEAACVTHARGGAATVEFRVGPATDSILSVLSLFARASKSPPNHSRPCLHAMPSSQPPEVDLSPHEFKC